MSLDSVKIEVIRTCEEMSRISAQIRAEGKKVGFVPTMGALHDGHLSLVRESLKQTDVTIVSIYVNPTQFAPDEDLSKYPRPFESDLELLENLGVSHVFAPTDDIMYPASDVHGETGYGGTLVQPPEIAAELEGLKRPAHFQGVVTIVLKLFNVVCPEVAFFGQKDYQQALVIQQMAKDLNLSVDIQICPIVREKSGLALSSRNVYLSESEKVQAQALSASLTRAANLVRAGQTNRKILENEMTDSLHAAGIRNIEYTAVACAKTLKQPDQIRMPVVCLVAAYVGSTRLIDNTVIDKNSN